MKRKEMPPLTEAQKALADANHGLTAKMVCYFRRRYGLKPLTSGEAYSAAAYALVRAAACYRPDKGASFVTYAARGMLRKINTAKFSHRWHASLTQVDGKDLSVIARGQQRTDNLTLAALMNCLPRHHRHVVERIELDGLTLKELSAELGVSQQAVQQQHKRALSRLREQAFQLYPGAFAHRHAAAMGWSGASSVVQAKLLTALASRPHSDRDLRDIACDTYYLRHRVIPRLETLGYIVRDESGCWQLSDIMKARREQ